MLNLALLRYNYLGALDTPIVCAAPAYQGLDLNESLLIRFVGLELFAGRTTELFLVAFLDIVPPNANLPERLPYIGDPCRQGGIQRHTCRANDTISSTFTAFLHRLRVFLQRLGQSPI
jgi:hypothetical protein